MITVGIGFERMQTRFLDRIGDDVIRPQLRKFLMRAGGAIRITAKRQFQSRAQKPVSELTEDQLKRYRRNQERYKAGQLKYKPRRPDKVARPGESPRVHTDKRSESPLAGRIYFALADNNASVVIGPDLLNKKASGITLEKLEQRFPFMEPAFQIIEPRLPGYWPR